MKEIEVDATIDNINMITEFVENELDIYNCSENEKINVNIAVDEIVSNVAKYAYVTKPGKVMIQIDITEKDISISFIDRGIPYNPLEKNDPDVTLSVEERNIGGLGVFLVKKLMDEMEYEYVEDKNILKIKKLRKM